MKSLISNASARVGHTATYLIDSLDETSLGQIDPLSGDVFGLNYIAGTQHQQFEQMKLRFGLVEANFQGSVACNHGHFTEIIGHYHDVSNH